MKNTVPKLYNLSSSISIRKKQDHSLFLTCLASTSRVTKNMKSDTEPIVFRSFSTPGLDLENRMKERKKKKVICGCSWVPVTNNITFGPGKASEQCHLLLFINKECQCLLVLNTTAKLSAKPTSTCFPNWAIFCLGTQLGPSETLLSNHYSFVPQRLWTTWLVWMNEDEVRLLQFTALTRIWDLS